MSHNFTPTLYQVQVASRKLPEVTLWPEREIAIAIPVSGKSQLVIFEKYTKKNKESSSTVRWTYKGEAIVSK